MNVLDKGFVNLEAHMGDDLMVVNAARVSLNNRSEWDLIATDYGLKPQLNTKDEGLIKFLMRERHGTPFEHNAFTFHVKCPIFVAREWMRHRIGSFNEMSGRYTHLEPDFYVPEYVRTQTGKPGAYTFEPMSEFDKNHTQSVLEEAYEGAWNYYWHLIDRGVAKELARLALPVGIYTQFYWTVNARSLMNFLSLRNADTAMHEIRQYAIAVEDLFRQVMPVTAEAFVANGRVAP